MTTKTILAMGLGSGVTEAGIRSWHGRFGPVVRVDIIREGNAANPVALVEMAIGDGVAAYLASRLSKYWHDGAVVNAWPLMH